MAHRRQAVDAVTLRVTGEALAWCKSRGGWPLLRRRGFPRRDESGVRGLITMQGHGIPDVPLRQLGNDTRIRPPRLYLSKLQGLLCSMHDLGKLGEAHGLADHLKV